MEISKTIKKFSMLIAMLLILAAATLSIKQAINKHPQLVVKTPTVEQPSQNPPALQELVSLPPGQLPEGITKDMILADDAVLVESYEYTKKDTGINQSTIRFFTKKTPAEIQEQYRNYLNSNWKIIEEKKEKTNLIYFAAEKDQTIFYITIQPYIYQDNTLIIDLTMVK